MRDESHTCPKCPKSWKLFRWNFHQKTIYWACYRSELNEHNSKNVLSRNPRANSWIIRCLKTVLSHSDQRVATWNQSLKLTCWEPVLTGVHSRTRGETMVVLLPSQQEGSHAKKVWIYSIFCILHAVWIEKKAQHGKRISSTQKPPDIYHQSIYHSVFQKTHQSIVWYCQKRVSWISVQSSQQPLCKQASLHGQACNS